MENGGLEYDKCGGEYASAARFGNLGFFREHVEKTLFLNLLKNSVPNSTILDAPCGEGRYSRLFRQLGAKKVYGIDISSEMIALAKSIPFEHQEDLIFEAVDLVSWKSPESFFDIAICVFLFDNATSKDMVLSFTRKLYSCLKEGGKVFGYDDNPDHPVERFLQTAHYGFVKRAPSLPLKEFDTFQIELELPQLNNNNYEEKKEEKYFASSLVINSHVVYPMTIEWAFKEAGFSSFKLHNVTDLVYSVPNKPDDYLAELHNYPPLFIFEATK